jgi:hypothetical protein
MICKRPLEPLAGRRGADQSVEEDSPVTVGQDERFMLRNRPPCSVRERGHAKIRQFAPFELRRPFDQRLSRFIDAKPKPFFPKPSVDLCWHAMVTSSNTCTSIGLTFQDALGLPLFGARPFGLATDGGGSDASSRSA